MMLPSSHVTITYDVISSLLKKFEESKIIVKEVSMKKFYIKTFNSFLKQCESVQLRDPNWLFDMGGFRFPIKTKLPSTYLNSRVIRDNFKRQQVANNEVTVKALKYIARNTTLPPRPRMEAQLQLSVMPNYTRMTQIKNRCVETGHSRFVLSDFRLCRSQFRELARKGDLPGVKKGVW